MRIDPRERELWPRNGAVPSSCWRAAANWDAALLRRAALEVASEWTNRGARDCSARGGSASRLVALGCVVSAGEFDLEGVSLRVGLTITWVGRERR